MPSVSKMLNPAAKAQTAEHTRATAEARLAQLSAGMRVGGGEPSASGTYLEMVSAKVAEGMSKQAALLQVQREFPDAHKGYLASFNRR
jgi:hypothetical protein